MSFLIITLLSGLNVVYAKDSVNQKEYELRTELLEQQAQLTCDISGAPSVVKNMSSLIATASDDARGLQNQVQQSVENESNNLNNSYDHALIQTESFLSKKTDEAKLSVEHLRQVLNSNRSEKNQVLIRKELRLAYHHYYSLKSKNVREASQVYPDIQQHVNQVFSKFRNEKIKQLRDLLKISTRIDQAQKKIRNCACKTMDCDTMDNFALMTKYHKAQFEYKLEKAKDDYFIPVTQQPKTDEAGVAK
jgi:hypothetical protein